MNATSLSLEHYLHWKTSTGCLKHRNNTYIQTFPVYSLSVPQYYYAQYYYVHTNVSGLRSERRIFDITPPTLSVSHISTVPIVVVGNERRTKMG